VSCAPHAIVEGSGDRSPVHLGYCGGINFFEKVLYTCREKKVPSVNCIIRESNPGLTRGRGVFYH
jgi:hypothetical protein